jgi:hypothetical protein
MSFSYSRLFIECFVFGDFLRSKKKVTLIAQLIYTAEKEKINTI